MEETVFQKYDRKKLELHDALHEFVKEVEIGLTKFFKKKGFEIEIDFNGTFVNYGELKAYGDIWFAIDFNEEYNDLFIYVDEEGIEKRVPQIIREYFKKVGYDCGIYLAW